MSDSARAEKIASMARNKLRRLPGHDHTCADRARAHNIRYCYGCGNMVGRFLGYLHRGTGSENQPDAYNKEYDASENEKRKESNLKNIRKNTHANRKKTTKLIITARTT